MGECYLCNGTGKLKKTNDREKYDEVFDKYDSMGVYCMEDCRDKALDYTGYEIIKCPKCGGTGIE